MKVLKKLQKISSQNQEGNLRGNKEGKKEKQKILPKGLLSAQLEFHKEKTE